MKIIVALALIIVISNFSFSQKFTAEIGFGQNQFAMESVNRYYMDSFAFQPQYNLLHEHIRTGKQLHMNMAYRPNGLFDIGMYVSFQQGGTKGFPVHREIDFWDNSITYHRGCLELRTKSLSFGLSNTWYISHLLDFQEKETTLNRVHLGVELMGGYGFSTVEHDLFYPTLEDYERVFTQHTAQAFQSQFGLKIEYDFIKNPIFTSLGIRGGYQYFRTGAVKNKLNEEWIVLDKYPMNLDFSGFYFGVYMKLGR